MHANVQRSITLNNRLPSKKKPHTQHTNVHVWENEKIKRRRGGISKQWNTIQQ